MALKIGDEVYDLLKEYRRYPTTDMDDTNNRLSCLNRIKERPVIVEFWKDDPRKAFPRYLCVGMFEGVLVMSREFYGVYLSRHTKGRVGMTVSIRNRTELDRLGFTGYTIKPTYGQTDLVTVGRAINLLKSHEKAMAKLMEKFPRSAEEKEEALPETEEPHGVASELIGLQDAATTTLHASTYSWDNVGGLRTFTVPSVRWETAYTVPTASESLQEAVRQWSYDLAVNGSVTIATHPVLNRPPVCGTTTSACLCNDSE